LQRSIWAAKSIPPAAEQSASWWQMLWMRKQRVGVEPTGEGEGTRLGWLVVGRLAVHRIGSVSTWTTTAGQVRSAFTLRTNNGERLKVEEESVSAESPSGTTIEIFNVLDTGKNHLTQTRIANDLLSQYCSFLLGHTKRRIRVNGEELAVEELFRINIVSGP
jgi:hypothetical protein